MCFSTIAAQIKYVVEVSELRSHEREVDNVPCKLGNMAICVFVPTDELYERSQRLEQQQRNADRMDALQRRPLPLGKDRPYPGWRVQSYWRRPTIGQFPSVSTMQHVQTPKPCSRRSCQRTPLGPFHQWQPNNPHNPERYDNAACRPLSRSQTQ